MYYFEPLAAYQESLQKYYGTPASDLIVYKDGREVYRHMTGFSDAENRIPTSSNDLYRMYSATKIATCTAGMRLIEDGKLSLEDPVSKYLPGFADITVRQPDQSVAPAKNVMTVRHLFSMRGGLDYNMQRGGSPRIIMEKGDQAGTVEICNSYAEAPLDFEPGTHYQYSLCHDVLGAVIEVASGMKFGDYMRKVIFDPLEMNNTFFLVNDEQLARVSEMRQWDEDAHKAIPIGKGDMYRLTPNYQSGCGGLTSSADDYMKLGAALANRGTGLNGYQLLKPETVELFRTPQLGRTEHMDMMRAFPYMPGYDYALGVRTFLDNSGSTAPKGHFGWDGAGGFLMLMDPENNVCIVFAEAILGNVYSVYYIHNKIRDLVYLCLRGDIREMNEEVSSAKNT